MRRFLALALGLVLLAGCAPAQPVDADQSADISQPPAQSIISRSGKRVKLPYS